MLLPIVLFLAESIALVNCVWDPDHIIDQKSANKPYNYDNQHQWESLKEKPEGFQLCDESGISPIDIVTDKINKRIRISQPLVTFYGK